MYILSCKWRRAFRPVYVLNNAAGLSSGLLVCRWVGSSGRFECSQTFETLGTADQTTGLHPPRKLFSVLGVGGGGGAVYKCFKSGGSDNNHCALKDLVIQKAKLCNQKSVSKSPVGLIPSTFAVPLACIALYP
jgi:hypothetical protein